MIEVREPNSLIEGPEWDALVDAVVCEAEAEQIVADEVQRLVA